MLCLWKTGAHCLELLAQLPVSLSVDRMETGKQAEEKREVQRE